MTRRWFGRLQSLGAPRPLASDNPHNIVYVLVNAGYGGAEIHLRDLVLRIDRTEFNPTVLLGGDGAEVLGPQLRDSGVHVEALPRPACPLDPVRFSYVARWIRRHRADIVHVHMPYPTHRSTACWAARASRTPVLVSTEHSRPEPLDGLGWRLLKGRARARIHLQNQMIAVSAAQAATFRQILRVPSDKITVIHNGIDPTTFSAGGLGMAIRDELGVPGSSPVLGMATGYFEYERVEDFLDAGARVLERVPAAHFFVVGDRHPTRSDKTARRRAELKRLALRLGLAQRVHFLGYRPDMASVLAALDVFVLPATFKCFGLILLEAMASAVPVVATDQGGAPEIVRHEQTGLLVPPLSPTALSNAIVRILRDPQTATRMGHCGRQVVREQFTTGLMVERTTTLYRSLLNDRRRVLSQGQLITR